MWVVVQRLLVPKNSVMVTNVYVSDFMTGKICFMASG